MTTPTGALASALDHYALAGQQTQKKAELDQNAFLKLMMTQLKNQDPTKPMDSSAFLGQIAQFSTVSGIGELQKSFGLLSTALQSNQALQSSTMVGRTVMVERDSAPLAADGLRGAVELPQSTGSLMLGIYSRGGELVKQISLGAQSAGTVPFTWNGLDDAGAALPAGQYVVKAEAQTADGPRAVGTWIAAKVESVSVRANEAPRLNLAGLGAVTLDQIKQVQ